ncbi:hypothetical protein H0E84_01875 [Luteimonas sp. SJ-92]|uniref:Uncharacterized protein n=1 Tax=Luteimonas salinisoli TaxID=2752307 RepID=A0A853J7Q2_9GAMM|nr:hypothetical protein [Luteimonas salinisoli]NZA25123.1 hypothetical protein [Luteimonas salinisoli]
MIRWAVIAFAFVLSACSGQADSEQILGDGDESKCAYVGNDPSRIHCATTYIQVLADPNFYDGRRIMITAWAVSNEGMVVIFPNEDSMLTVETHASMRVKDGEGFGELEQYLEPMKYGASRVMLGGIFHMRSRDPDQPRRFGTLSDVELMRR